MTFNGSVNFRCRYQNNTTYCFAYYCQNPKDSGCKQAWRIEWKINPQNMHDNQFKAIMLQNVPGESWEPIIQNMDLNPGAYDPGC